MKLTNFPPKPTLLCRAAENLSTLLIEVIYKVMVSNTPEPFTISSRVFFSHFPISFSSNSNVSLQTSHPITYSLILERGFVLLV